MINKLLNMVTSLSKDKILHYFIAYILFDIVLSIGIACNLNVWINLLISISIITLFIIGKEVYDYFNPKGVVDAKDIYAGYLGACTKLIIFTITLL